VNRSNTIEREEDRARPIAIPRDDSAQGVSLPSSEWDVSDDTKLVLAIHGSLYIDTDIQKDIDWNAISRQFANRSALACESRYMLIKEDDERQITLWEEQPARLSAAALEIYDLELQRLQLANKCRLRLARLELDSPNLARGGKTEPEGASVDMNVYRMQMMRLRRQIEKRVYLSVQDQGSLAAPSASSPYTQSAQTDLLPPVEATEHVRDTTKHIPSFGPSRNDIIRNPPQYQDVAPGGDGLYHSLYKGSCNHEPTKLRRAHPYE
jgi:hypothetical protein